jgi:hypothetical protein
MLSMNLGLVFCATPLLLFEEREADWIDANGLYKIFFRKRNLNNTNIIRKTLHL